MFNCKTRRSRKNADKIEGMASWLIFGGVFPLAWAVIIYHLHDLQGYGREPILTPDRMPYLWVITMGIASLLAKRASVPWQATVGLGMIGLMAAAELSRETGTAPGTIWPVAVLLLIIGQYRFDMRIAQANRSLN